MRTSQYLLFTIKEAPTDAELISHQLMLRAGMIRKLASGLYTWLPTGLRVLRKAENIIREEVNNVGAIEISMPMVQPANLWQESKRLLQYGSELLRFSDRNKRLFVLGPTHEEVITNIVRNEVRSYKQLPLNFYQIQTKFRDELRPRYGVMRAREFLMKDGYSFHTTEASLQKTYDLMCQVYKTIFTRMELEFLVVKADTGTIGGIVSHEFQVLSDSGEEEIVYSTESNYTSNITLASPLISRTKIPSPTEQIRLVEVSPNCTIEELIVQFSIPIEKTIKIILVHASKEANHPLVALVIRGDHKLNHLKAEKLPHIAVPIIIATDEEIRKIVGVGSNAIGPINLSLPIVIDHSVAVINDFVTGANIEGKYFFGVNWVRDVPLPQRADIRKVTDGDISPDGKGILKIKHGIEVAHIFQLGTKYSKSMKTNIQGKEGYNQILTMGCYGIGITRLIAATIEQKHDKRGILWPNALAPFNVVLLPINMHKSLHVQTVTETLYRNLKLRGIDVLLDDRKERPGVMFSDMELIGIPYQLIISERNLHVKNIEYRNWRTGEQLIIKLNVIIDFLTNELTLP
ncbi:prolyl-tRNA synthetase [secondary endosymbiont of Heteropsylla cubana]|uniref:Proline--tRNA ligase n=1 Tax=secondary endosymbiont of Heteropsylla cubana TaxID=134287 RepID=J3Z5A1_9ENTR|nr:proline--tRNA ligase [secondary endosymbiont of Heteropsylla cubana]AFP85494.1 prolyl-tRNA synthetase [secondary endosymbiont of Heteropsylla cubana]